MRILFQYFAPGHGGGFSNVACLLGAMAEQFSGDEIHVACTPKSVPHSLRSSENLEIHLTEARRPFEMQRLILESSTIPRLARDLRADVIWSLNLGPYVRTGIPQVLSLNNAFQTYPWRECARYHPSPGPVLAGLRFFFRRSLRCSDAAIVQTPLMQRYLAALSGAPRAISVIPKAVEDLKQSSGASPPDAAIQASLPDSFKFLYVATAEPHKNHATVIAALGRLLARGLNVQLYLTLTPEQALTRGGPLAGPLIDRNHIACLGWVPKGQLRGLYDHCDACVMPSLLESLSSANLESMAWDKPQIISDRPFARDLCGDAAIYVPAEDPQAWDGAMERLLRDEREREHLIAQGRARILGFPATWGDMARQVRATLHAATVMSPLGVSVH